MLNDPEQEWLLWSDTKKLSGFMGMTACGRVEPKTTQGCLPKSRHSLKLRIKNFANIITDRQ